MVTHKDLFEHLLHTVPYRGSLCVSWNVFCYQKTVYYPAGNNMPSTLHVHEEKNSALFKLHLLDGSVIWWRCWLEAENASHFIAFRSSRTGFQLTA